MKFKGIRDLYIGLIGGATTILIDTKVLSLVVGEGPSMQPTLLPHSVLVVKKYGISKEELTKGKIILTKTSYDDRTIVVKRIAAVPGEKVMVDGAKELTLSKNHYYLLGDNPSQSFDSRHYGPIPIHMIEGIVVGSLYPKFESY